DGSGQQPPEQRLWPQGQAHRGPRGASVTHDTDADDIPLAVDGLDDLRRAGSNSVSPARLSTRLPDPSSTASSRYSAPLRATSLPPASVRVRVMVSSRQPPKEKPRTLSGLGSRGACAVRRRIALMRPRSSRGLNGLPT